MSGGVRARDGPDRVIVSRCTVTGSRSPASSHTPHEQQRATRHGGALLSGSSLTQGLRDMLTHTARTTTALRAPPTRYAGCHFRSRLEARWAVFFDQLGIPWEHEPDGFETAAGNYLPDFRVRISQVKSDSYQWFEVKPPGAPLDDRHEALAAESGMPLIIARGMPRNYIDQVDAPLTALGLGSTGGGRGGAVPAMFTAARHPDRDTGTVPTYCALGAQRHWCNEQFGRLLPDVPHLAIGCDQGVGVPNRSAAAVVDAAYTAAHSARFDT